MDAKSPAAQPDVTARGWRPDRCDRVALVLQGGGALGAYQAGVYQALHEAGIEPDWVSGVSIGAINAAIIAGNPPVRRLERLRAFWERITERKIWHYTPDGDLFRQMRNATSTWMTMAQGQPGFFSPHPVSPWLSLAGAKSATSHYDTAPLRETLAELVDFDRINAGPVRFAVGAVNVLTGNFTYFDSAEEQIGPDHVMASGALPPALPMVKIGTDHYWDGGIVSNTPLQHLLDQDGGLNTLVFQVDSVQRPRAAAARHERRDGPAQGHHVLVAHPLHHRPLQAARTCGRPAWPRRWRRRREEALTAEERRMRDEPGASAGDHHPAPDLPAEGL